MKNYKNILLGLGAVVVLSLSFVVPTLYHQSTQVESQKTLQELVESFQGRDKVAVEELGSYFGTTNYLLEVARGNIPGHTLVHKFGRNTNVSGSLVPVVNGGFFRTPTTTVTIEAISDDTNDSFSGTGAQQITVSYINDVFAEATSTIDMNGTSASTNTIANVLRINRAFVSRSGTYATQSASSQKGTITIRESGGGQTWATIPEVGTTGFAVGQSLIGAYTVPTGKTAYILSQNITVDTNQAADLYFFKRENIDDITAPYTGNMRVQNIYAGIARPFSYTHLTYEPYPEKTDIGFLATAGATADVSVEFELLLITN